MRVALCDDNRADVVEAEQALSEFAEEWGVDPCLVSFDTIEALLASSDLGSFDFVFINMELEGKPVGIEAAERISKVAPNCQVVFLTNSFQHSDGTRRTNHAWFVVKSQIDRCLSDAIGKAARIDEAKRNFIVVTLKDGSVLNVACRDILYFERRKRITYIVTADATYETSEKLADICKKLPEIPFAYSHSSYVVNMPHIEQIHTDELVFRSGQTVPVSRRYAKRFRDRYFSWAEQWMV